MHPLGISSCALTLVLGDVKVKGLALWLMTACTRAHEGLCPCGDKQGWATPADVWEKDMAVGIMNLMLIDNLVK